MVCNEGKVDRIIRIVCGVALLSMIVVGPQTWFGLIGLVPLATGLVAWCPLYDLFGVSSCPKRDERGTSMRDAGDGPPVSSRVGR